MNRLSAQELPDLLASIPLWKHAIARGGTINREFLFRDFAEAFAFMAHVAILAEKRDHHPEWSNVYNRVNVTLTTHDVDGLSMNDFDLARAMDAIALARNIPLE